MEKNKTTEFLFEMGRVSLGITVMRVILAAISAIYMLIIQSSTEILVLIIICIVLLDQLDGMLFKKSYLNNIYKWKRRRRILDSCCDRLCIQLFCLPLLVGDNSFFIPYFAILIKEFLTSYICIRAYCQGLILNSNIMGKLSSVLIGLIVITWLIDLKIMMYLLVPMIIIFGMIAYHKYNIQYNKVEE